MGDKFVVLIFLFVIIPSIIILYDLMVYELTYKYSINYICAKRVDRLRRQKYKLGMKLICCKYELSEGVDNIDNLELDSKVSYYEKKIEKIDNEIEKLLLIGKTNN